MILEKSQVMPAVAAKTTGISSAQRARPSLSVVRGSLSLI
jgi:hypothetical protein